MRSALLEHDLISRFGGEEFVIVLPEIDLDRAVSALQRAQEQLVVAVAQSSVPSFTVSFGVAHSDTSGSLEDLIRLADHAPFSAKREGRNRVVAEQSHSGADIS
jgi:diguanylate cyclase (GGDEF)-like protein